MFIQVGMPILAVLEKTVYQFYIQHRVGILLSQ